MRSTPRAARAVLALAVAAPLVALGGCSAGLEAPAASLEEMEPVTLSWVGGPGAFIDYVQQQTDKVSFETYVPGLLFPPNETVANLGSGVADLAQWSTSETPNELPVENWSQALGSQTDPSFAFGLLQATGASYEMHLRNQALIDEYAGHNVKVLTAQAQPRPALLCREQVTTLAQAEGQITLVGNVLWSPELEAMRMQPMFTPFAESYESLLRGILDCVVAAPSQLVSMSLTDSAKHFVDLPMSTSIGSVVAINLDRWNSFPAELQQIFLEAGAVQAAQIAGEGMERLVRIVAEAGQTGVVVEDGAELAAIVRAEQAENVAALPGSAPAEAGDAQAFIDEYLGYLERWRGIVAETSPFEAGEEHGLVDFAAAVPADYDWAAAYQASFLEVAGEALGG